MAEIADALEPGLDDLVTVVVPARNEERTIHACLDSILDGTYANVEVLVVDGDSSDATTAIVEDVAARDARVRLLHNPERRIPIALNLALREARGRWLVRVDAHSTVPPGYVDALVEHLRTGRWGGAGGRKDAVGRGRTGRAIEIALGSRFGVGNSAYHYAETAREVDHVPFGAYPTALLRSLGGWDERLVANEDYEIDYRIRANGHRLLLDPSVRIEWRCSDTIPALFEQYRRYGRGKADVAWLHPRSLAPRHLAPPALMLALAASLATIAITPAVAAIVVGTYAAGLAGAGVVTTHDARRAPTVAAAFAAMHLGWGVGIWSGLAANAASALGRRLPFTAGTTRRAARRPNRFEEADTNSTSSSRAA